MALSESSTNNIANNTIEIVEVGHSRSEFEINQGKGHNVMDQNAEKSSSGDIASSSDNAIDSPLKFVGEISWWQLKYSNKKYVYNVDSPNRKKINGVVFDPAADASVVPSFGLVVGL
ncbi:hypothetical protein L1987_86674 [Smallanthus sonchifolius]|uniref:Uncharacterized protein n=1 Tax=Smallanthus sonchifolius TaxID=185202 RepID=A0ACB8Y042_9ASTR|nr:hypothetical protein L1987_86674 [Smallanthus sonchifolius]